MKTEKKKEKKISQKTTKTPPRSPQPFRGLNVGTGNPGRRCFCCCIANDTPGGLITDPENGCDPCPIIAVDNNPFCLALGFNGDNASRPDTPACAPVGGVGSAPVTRRRMEGPDADAVPLPPSVSFDDDGSAVLVSNPAKGRLSAPRACRRAFSCFAWTARK